MGPNSALGGDLDLTFGSGGKVITDFAPPLEEADAVAVLSDGKILVAGTYSDDIEGPTVYVVRYLSTGAIDPAFSTNGKSTFIVPGTHFDSVSSISILSDGKIILSGDASNDSQVGNTRRDMYVVRLAASGALDTTFNSTGRVTLGSSTLDEVTSSATVAPDGNIWVAGRSDYYAAIGIATPDGHSYESHGFQQGFRTFLPSLTNIDSFPTLHNLAAGPDNKMYAVGSAVFPDDPQSYDLFVMRFNLDGTVDTTSDPSGYIRLTTPGVSEYSARINVRSDGKIVIGYGANGYVGALRLLPLGHVDTSFGTFGRAMVPLDPNGDGDYLSAMVIRADGKIVFGGNHQATQLHSDFFAARLLPDGGVDGTFGSGGRRSLKVGNSDSSANGLAVQSDKSLILVGSAYLNQDFNPVSAVVRLTGESAFSIDLDDASDKGLSNTDNYTNATTLHFTVASPGLYNLYRDGILIASASTATAFTDTGLTEGQHVYTLALSDDAGNDSLPFILQVTVDTTPTPATPVLLASSDTGLSSSDNITSDNTPDFGFAKFDQFRLYRNGAEITSGYTSGIFTAPAQPDGVWNYTAETIDLAGNVAGIGAPLMVTIDTLAPQMPAIPDLDPANDSGISDSDNITSFTTFNFLPLTANAPYVRLFKNGQLLSTNYYPANSAFTATALGTDLFTLAAVDIAGNVSAASPALTISASSAPPSLSGLAMSVDYGFDASVPAFPLGENESLQMGKHLLMPDGKILIAAQIWNHQTGMREAALVRLLPTD